MNDDRLSGLSENTFTATVARLRSDLDELRSRQPTSRDLITRTYQLSTANAIDLGPIVVPAGLTEIISLEYTAPESDSQRRPYGIQYSKVYNGGTTEGHRLSDFLLADAGGTFYNWDTDPVGNDPLKIGWRLYVTAGGSGATIYVKVRFLMNRRGGSVSASW